MGFSRGINYRGSQGLKRVATKHKDHAHRLRARRGSALAKMRLLVATLYAVDW